MNYKTKEAAKNLMSFCGISLNFFFFFFNESWSDIKYGKILALEKFCGESSNSQPSARRSQIIEP